MRQNQIIHANYPTDLIYKYLKIMDDLMLCEDIQTMYDGEKQKLRKDILKLIMFGLSGPK